MALLKIARLGHPVLRRKAEPVGDEELASAELQRFIDDMAETMRDSDGVGLAAPQVYSPRRIILVEVKGANPRYAGQGEVPLTVLINPRIVGHSQEQEEEWEGCLSIPDLRGRVPRWRSVRVSGQGREGRAVELEASGFFARVLQHEVDHLDGVMFLDRMRDFSTLTHLREFQKFWTGPAA